MLIPQFNRLQIRQGFTIVELLIVIVVIAILAAISIVAYNGIQGRSYDSAIQSDLANMAKKMEVYRALDSSGHYPTSLAAAGLDIKVSKGAYGDHYSANNGYNLLLCTSTSGSPGFAIVGRSKSGTTYAISSSRSAPYVSSQTLTTWSTQCPAEGVSPFDGSWTYSNGAWIL